MNHARDQPQRKSRAKVHRPALRSPFQETFPLTGMLFMPQNIELLPALFTLAGRFGWCLFPAVWYGKNRKHPLVDKQHERSTTDPEQLERWWGQWPQALIGVSAGRKSGVVCLAIATKKPRPNACHTLDPPCHPP